MSDAERWEWHTAWYIGYGCPREWKARLTASEWAKVKQIRETDFIGEDRADRSRQLAAIGVMSSLVKLNGYDTNALLPNPPPEKLQTVEEQFAAMLAFSGK